MLKQLEFTNFKSWQRANIFCAPITGVFGTNSSGKTSILQFILLLKQTKDATDRSVSLDLNGEFVELGLIGDAIYKHDVERSISYSVVFDVAEELVLNDPSQRKQSVVAKGDRIGLNADIEVHKGLSVATRISYEIGNMEFVLQSKGGSNSQFDLSAESISINLENDFRFLRAKGRAWQLPGPIKSYAFPDQARTYFQNAGFLADLESSYEKFLDNMYYLGPLREVPKRDYIWSRSRPTDVGQRGERAIEAILAATADGETRNLKYKGKHKPFQEIIAHWLREMGLIADFRVEEIAPGSNRWQAKVKTRRDSAEVLLTDVGFGISQVLPVVTLLQYVPEGSTVLLEQPEIHLHPLAQAGLADVIIQAAVHRRIQIITESHSEHLLLRLQRRIAEKEISDDQVMLYFCHMTGGSSQAERLEVDLYGNIANWPDNFMGDAFGETAKAELARLKRMKAAR